MEMLSGTQPVSPEVYGLTASDEIPVAATSKGVFKPDQIYGFSGYKNVLSGHNVRYQLDTGSMWLAGANDGIYAVAYDYGGRADKVIDLRESVAAISAKTGIYFATSSGIFRYGNN